MGNIESMVASGSADLEISGDIEICDIKAYGKPGNKGTLSHVNMTTAGDHTIENMSISGAVIDVGEGTTLYLVNVGIKADTHITDAPAHVFAQGTHAQLDEANTWADKEITTANLSLLAPDETFSLEPYFPAITEEFALLGQSAAITQKKKTRQTAIRSAFLKSETAQYNLHLERGRNITVKIEVDTTPPPNFDTEHLLLLQPRSFYARCYTLPSLFAGKLSALMFHAWKNRVKGRDWFDFEWNVRHGVPRDFRHFKERAVQGGMPDAANLTPDTLRLQLHQKIVSVPIGTVKEDVYPFVRQPDQLDIWTTDYFLPLAEKMAIAVK